MTWIVFDEPDYIFGSGVRPGVIQRVFITLDSAQQGHYLIQNPVILAGDFDISIEAATTDTTSFVALMGHTTITGNAIQYDNAGSIRFRIPGGNFTFTAQVKRDGDFHILRFVRSGTNLTMFQDDINLETLTSVSTQNVVINTFGQTLNISFFDGIIANPDLGNGNAWKLDRGLGNTEQAANGNNLLTYVNIPEGAPDRELFTKNTSTTPDQWENSDKSRIIQIA